MKGFSLIFFSCFVLNCNAEPEKKINASFDCNKAKQPIEKAICSNSELANLDLKMSKAYREKRKQSSKNDAAALKKLQKIWLKERIYNCDITKATYNKENHIQCLVRKYTKHINDLSENEVDRAAFYKSSIHDKKHSLIDRKKWKELINWPDSCASDDLQYMSDSGLSFYNIDKNHVVLQVTCQQYAYQSQSMLYSLFYSNDQITVSDLRLLQLKDNNSRWGVTKSNKLTGHFQFYPKDKSFLTINKYSGAGQCGHSTTYKSELNSGVNLVLDRAWGNPDCSINMTVEDWPEISL